MSHIQNHKPMLELIGQLTSGDISLLLVGSYIMYYLVDSTYKKVKTMYNMGEKFVDSVELIAINSSEMVHTMDEMIHSIDGTNDKLSAISSAASRFNNITESNNWTNIFMEMVKLYTPMLIQTLTTSKPTVNPDIFISSRCTRPMQPCGYTGPTGPTGPFTQTSVVPPPTTTTTTKSEALAATVSDEPKPAEQIILNLSDE